MVSAVSTGPISCLLLPPFIAKERIAKNKKSRPSKANNGFAKGSFEGPFQRIRYVVFNDQTPVVVSHVCLLRKTKDGTIITQKSEMDQCIMMDTV